MYPNLRQETRRDAVLNCQPFYALAVVLKAEISLGMSASLVDSHSAGNMHSKNGFMSWNEFGVLTARLRYF